MSDQNEIKIRDLKELSREEQAQIYARWLAGDYEIWNWPCGNGTHTLYGDVVQRENKR